MIQSAFMTEGYYDTYNMNANKLKLETGGLSEIRKQGATLSADNSTIRYEFVFTPNTGFLASPDLLLKDTELKISFDRTNPGTSLLELGTIETECKYLEIKDCYAVTEYVSSQEIRDYFEIIERTPFVYEYEEVEVLVKNLPLNETDIRFDNIRGGPLPYYMFVGLIPQNALNGDSKLSSTSFECQNLTDINITLNGNSVHGYPINIKNNSPIFPLQKFLDVTGQLYNPESGSATRVVDYEYNFIHAHVFEAESSETGWISVNLKLSVAPTEPMSMVMWFVSSCALSIDKFHSVERINC